MEELTKGAKAIAKIFGSNQQSFTKAWDKRQS